MEFKKKITAIKNKQLKREKIARFEVLQKEKNNYSERH